MTFLQRRAYSIGAGFAALLWPFFVRRRRLSVDNVLKCGIARDRRAAARVAAAAWRHFAGHLCEALCVPAVAGRDRWRECIDTSEADPSAAALLLDTPDEPIILVSAHHGAWEAATNMISFARPMIAIARTMNNKAVARWLEKHHFRGPVTIIDKKHGITKGVLEKWERERSAMTILVDQHASRGERLFFLGRPARTVTSAARLAIRTGRRIVVGSFVRTGPYRYSLCGGPPLKFSRSTPVAAAAQIMNDRLSQAIRRHPEQYLWAHRRWRDG